jgi:hypothetical protein
MLNKRTQPRDYQRSAVYRAENAAFEGTKAMVAVSQSELEEMLTRIAAMPIFARISEKPMRLLINRRLKKTYAWAYQGGERDGEIDFNPNNLWPYLLCHEAAHIMASRARGYYNISGHGPEFVSFYLTIANEILGKGPATILARCFKAAGVDMK